MTQDAINKVERATRKVASCCLGADNKVEGAVAGAGTRWHLAPFLPACESNGCKDSQHGLGFILHVVI